MNRSRDPLPCLTGLRFVAALTVALCHFTEMGLLPLPQRVMVGDGFLDGGRPAVVLFFVLSGFILTYNYDGVLTRQGLAFYFVNRFARIYPIYFLCLTLSISLVAWMTLQGYTSEYLVWFALDHSKHVAFALGASLFALFLLVTAWTPVLLLDQPWNGVSWSLSCEAFFYLMFPWLLKRLNRLPTSRVLIVLTAFFLAEGAFFVIAHRLHDTSHFSQTAFVYQFPLPHLSEFVMGMGAALWFSRGGNQWLRRSWRATLLGCLSLGALVSLGFITLPLTHGWFPVSYPEAPFFATLILSLAVAPRFARWLSWPLFVLLGESSYSLYLVHAICGRMLSLMHPPTLSSYVGLVATIGLSILMFRFVERPWRERIRMAWKTRREHLQSVSSRTAARI